jgi:hypothetical protein
MWRVPEETFEREVADCPHGGPNLPTARASHSPSCKSVGSGKNQNGCNGRQSDELFHLENLRQDALVFCLTNPLHFN